MTLRVSTVSSDVFLYDLGIVVSHPTIERDLSLEFSAIDLKESVHLTQAIQNGSLLADDGVYTIHSSDYDPDEVLIQQLGYRDDTLYVSENELISKGDVYLKADTFPLALNSTAQVTKNIYCPTARWITWSLAPEDKVVIARCAAAGTYTVASVSDQQNFLTQEPLVDSTGGFISIYHPDAATRIGVDDALFDHIDGDTLHECLASIDYNFDLVSGINETTHRELDQLVHLVAEDAFEEYVFTSGKVTKIITWTNTGKTTKIREEQFAYNGNRLYQLVTIQYNSAGVEVERLTDTYTYAGQNVQSITKELELS